MTTHFPYYLALVAAVLSVIVGRCRSTTDEEGRDTPRERMTIDPISNGTSIIGLAAVGNLLEVHDTALYAKQVLQEEGNGTVQDLLLQSNVFLPFFKQDDYYDYEDETGDPHRDDDNNSNSTLRYSHSLWPVMAGEWLTASLYTRGAGHPPGSNDNCGAVFWHEDTVGSTVEAVAEKIQHNICVRGNAAMYNSNVDTESFANLGGRILPRSSWMPTSYSNPLNERLPKDHAHKLDTNWPVLRHGQPLLLTSSVTAYFDQSWPNLRDSLSNATFYNGETTNGTKDASYFSYWPGEYPAGRILTMAVTNEEEGLSRQVAYLLMIYDYESPELLDDILVETVPVSGQKALPFQTRDTFVSFVLDSQTTTEDLRDAFRSISTSKILQTIAWDYVLSDHHKDQQTALLRRILPALYGNGGIDNAPMIRYWLQQHQPEKYEEVVLLLESLDCLTIMVQEVQDEYNAYQHSVDPLAPPTMLLHPCPSQACAAALLRSGIVLDWEAVLQSRNRPDIHSYLVEQFRSQYNVADLDAILSEWIPSAVRNLDHAALNDTLPQLSPRGQEALFRNDTLELLEPPHHPLPCLSHPPPPVLWSGTLTQLAAAGFVLQYYHCLVDYRCLKRGGEDEWEHSFLKTVSVLESYRRPNDLPAPTSYELPRWFWRDVCFYYPERCVRGVHGKILAQTANCKLEDLVDRVFVHTAESQSSPACEATYAALQCRA